MLAEPARGDFDTGAAHVGDWSLEHRENALAHGCEVADAPGMAVSHNTRPPTMTTMPVVGSSFTRAVARSSRSRQYPIVRGSVTRSHSAPGKYLAVVPLCGVGRHPSAGPREPDCDCQGDKTDEPARSTARMQHGPPHVGRADDPRATQNHSCVNRRQARLHVVSTTRSTSPGITTPTKTRCARASMKCRKPGHVQRAR